SKRVPSGSGAASSSRSSPRRRGEGVTSEFYSAPHPSRSSPPPGKEPRGLDVAPDEPGRRGRRGSGRERSDPRPGRCRKACSKDLRIAPHQVPVPTACPNHPAAAERVWRLATERDGQLLHLGHL